MSFISAIKKDGDNIILYKCGEPMPELLISVEDVITIGFLDTETTGLDKSNDQIIELALKVVKFEKKSGKIISIDHEYESFNDPNEKLDEKICSKIANNLWNLEIKIKNSKFFIWKF